MFSLQFQSSWGVWVWRGGGGGLSCCICKRLCWIHREKVMRGNIFTTHLETTFVWKQLSEQTEEMERKQASVGLPCSPIPKLFLEKISVPEVTCNQWLKRCPRIFLQVRKEQCVIISLSTATAKIQIFTTSSQHKGPGCWWSLLAW